MYIEMSYDLHVFVHREECTMETTMISGRVDNKIVEKMNSISNRTKISKTLVINAALDYFFSLSDDERGKILLQYLSRSDE